MIKKVPNIPNVKEMEVKSKLAHQIKQLLPKITDEIHMMVAISLNRDYFFVKDYLDGTIEDIAFAQKLISFIKYILASRHIGCTKNNALFREVTLKVNIGIIMTNLACKEAHTLVTYIEEKTQKKYDDLREPLEKIVDTTNEENLKLLTQ